MYLKDRLIVGTIEILWTIVIFLFIMSEIIDFFFGLILIIIILIVGKIYLTLQVEKYKKEMHDNLEKMAQNKKQ